MQWISIVTAAVVIASGFPTVVEAQSAAPPPKRIKSCEPPNGLWGTDNAYRGRLSVYDNGTARLFIGSAGQPPTAMRGSDPFPASGGTVRSPSGSFDYTVSIEGDGYNVFNGYRFHVHYDCKGG